MAGKSTRSSSKTSKTANASVSDDSNSIATVSDDSRTVAPVSVISHTAAPVSDVTESDIDQLSEESRVLYMMINSKLDEVVKTINRKEERISHLEKECGTLRRVVAELGERLDELEAGERNDSVVMSGSAIPPGNSNENTIQIVQHIMKNNMNYDISREKITSAYRVGKKSISQGPDKRNILVKFINRDFKIDLIKTCKSYKPADLFVNENLTPHRSEVLSALRRAKRLVPDKISGAGSINGRVFVWLKAHITGSNKRIFINSRAKLEEQCEVLFGLQPDQLFNITTRQ